MLTKSGFYSSMSLVWTCLLIGFSPDAHARIYQNPALNKDDAICGSTAGAADCAAQLQTDNFTVNTPINGQQVSGTIEISGLAGNKWVNTRAYLSSNKAPLTSDFTPKNGAYNLFLDTTKLPNGLNNISVIAFSVPKGDSGGVPYQSKTVSLSFVVVNSSISEASPSAPALNPVTSASPTLHSQINGAPSTVAAPAASSSSAVVPSTGLPSSIQSSIPSLNPGQVLRPHPEPTTIPTSAPTPNQYGRGF